MSIKFQDVQAVSLRSSITACALTLVLSACGGGGGGGNGSTASTTTTTTGSPPPDPVTSLAISPNTLAFDKVVIGDTVAGTVVVNNTGETTVSVALPALGDGFAAAAGSCDDLAPEENCSLTVEFSPTEQIAYTSDVTITVDSEDLDLALSGEGQGLNVEIASIDQTCPGGDVDAGIIVKLSNGLTATGLRTDNLTAYLDGVEVDLTGIVLEDLTDRDPIAVAVVMDLSSSLDGSEGLLADATSIFIESLGHEEGGVIDRAALYKFGAEIDFANSQDFVDADDAGKTALDAALYGDFNESAANSKIWGSAFRVAIEIDDETIERRYLILLTDGLDNPYDPANTETLDDLIQILNENAIAAFPIGFGDVNPGPLQQLADATGGLFFSDPDADTLNLAFEQISSTFSDRYYIDIANPGGAGELMIRILDDAGREGEDTVTLPTCP